MRDHRKLRAFELADELALVIYRSTRRFPREEKFGLTSQLRRAAVSAVSNMVEGCARSSHPDYLRFLDMAYGSAKEVEYQISLALRLEYVAQPDDRVLTDVSQETSKVLGALIRSLRQQTASQAKA